MFSQFGKILDVVCLKTYRLRGQAWVVFADISGATNALRSLQDFPFFDKPLVRGRQPLRLPQRCCDRAADGRGGRARRGSHTRVASQTRWPSWTARSSRGTSGNGRKRMSRREVGRLRAVAPLTRRVAARC